MHRLRRLKQAVASTDKQTDKTANPQVSQSVRESLMGCRGTYTCGLPLPYAWFQSVYMQSIKTCNRPRLTSFLMAVQQTTYARNWVSARLPSTLAGPRTRNTPACRAKNMTPVNASRNNVVFFEHLFLGVSKRIRTFFVHWDNRHAPFLHAK